MEAKEAYKDGMAYIRAHPGRALQLPFYRIGRVLGLYRPIQQTTLDIFPEGREPFVAYSSAVLWYFLCAFGAIGGRSFRRRKLAIFPLVLPLIVVILATAITFGNVRYRAAFEPFLCVLAAAGVSHVWRTYRRLVTTPTTVLSRP